MFAVESLILALVALAVGVGIGIVTGRSSSSVKQSKDLELHLSKAKLELETYQQDVAKHFMDTAKKVGELTQNYRDLNQHLADGAMRLASTEITRDLIAAASDGKSDEDNTMDLTPVEPPKDWAPKIPGSHGMLSEEFGLTEIDGKEQATTSDTQKPAK